MLLLALAVAFLSLALTVRPAAAANPFPEDTVELREELRHSDVRIDWKREMPPTSKANYNRPAKLGDVRLWVALDGISGAPYLKEFQLRGTSKTAELWTAVDLAYPEGDCRNDPARINVTDAQVANMLLEFNHIRPIDTAWFGEPHKRTGANAELPALLGVNQNAYRDPAGRDVILVDNVVDENFEDTNNANSLPRIGGFFWPTITFYHDRNVITLDSFDWIARTGEDPKHTPSTDPCINSPARPELFEGTLAHEYQHLIHEDYDPDELNWVNEGMADFAELLTGYGDLNLHMDEMGYDGHIQGFLGWLYAEHPDWNPIPSESGPENSLTMWEDQDKPAEIFADYGFAYYFMSYLQSLGFDQSFFTAWHHNPANGIAGLESTLAASGSSETFRSLFTDVVVSALVDGFIDNGATVSGATTADRLQNDPTEATIFFSEDAYATPGAPVWGSDYVPLGPGAGIDSLTFDGAEEFLQPGGPEWIVDENGYWTTPDGAGEPYANDLDADITREVTAAAEDTLTFEHYYSIEATWDFGFVQVSTDGGATFQSLPCSGTNSDLNPSADPAIAANVPGYSGPSESDTEAYVGTAAEPVAVTCDLPTGTFLLSFRMMTDGAAQFDGWHVRDVRIGGALVDSSPEELEADWDNQAFFQPVPVGHIFQLVGLSGTVDQYGDILTGGDVVVIRPTLGAGSTYTLTDADKAALAGSTQVVAIVSGTADGDNGVYAPYSLVVNGEESADGAALP